MLSPAESRAAISTFIDTIFVVAIIAIIAILTFLSYSFELAGFEYLFGDAFVGASVPALGLSVLAGFALALNAARIGLTWQIARRRAAGDRKLLSSYLVRGATFANSAIMTLLVCSFSIVDPNAEALLADARDTRERAYYGQQQDLANEYDNRRFGIQDKYMALRQDANEHFRKAWEKLDADLKEESHVGGSNFYGPRYRKLEERMTNLEQKHAQRIQQLDARERAEMTAFMAERNERFEQLEASLGRRSSELSLADFAGTLEAQNQALVRFVTTLKMLVDHEDINPQTAAIVMTILITLLIEALPIVLLNGVIIITSPAQHRLDKLPQSPADTSDSSDKPDVIDLERARDHQRSHSNPESASDQIHNRRPQSTESG